MEYFISFTGYVPGMKGLRLLLLGCLAGLLVIAGCTTTQQAPYDVGILYTKGPGPMPTLLATNQIDGYIAWQPFVEIAPLSGIGKVVSYSEAFPPDDTWKNHPQNVLVAREDFVAGNPDLATALTALTIASDQYITDHPTEAAGITADWLAGGGNFTYGNVSVSSVTTMDRAITTIIYTTDPSPDWIAGTKKFIGAQVDLGYVTGILKNATPDQQDGILFDFGPYRNATMELNASQIVTPQEVTAPIGFGYLMAADHAALFVAVKDWQYFNSTYGIALVPQDPTAAKPDIVDLVVNGKKVATLKLIPGDAGPQLMQLAATGTIQASYVGVPPAIAAIDQGTPIKILSPVDTEGSGLVVTASSPASDWQSFVAWARQRSADGKPLKIADPGKGSIQDVMLRSALNVSGLSFQEVQS